MINYDDFISETVYNIPFSGIRKYFDYANENKHIISLGVGEPDFVTPQNIRQNAIKSIQDGKTKYSSNVGSIELREEISKYMHQNFDIKYSPKDQILVTAGASEGIDVALRAIINHGDEILYHEPCYVSYKPCILMAGGTPVAIKTENKDDFRLTADQILNKITTKTKAILLSFPNNPTGAIMKKDDLEKIAKVVIEKNLIVISDEIYAELTYGKNTHVSIASIEGMYERTIVLNGFSKAFAMTGWRLGFACGPEEIIKQMTKIHQYVIMCAPTMSQYAGIEALSNSNESVQNMRNSYNERRTLMLEGFRDMGLDVFEPLGAFYIFPSISITKMTSEQFCEKLLFEGDVAVVPGNAFGASGEGFIRCSYAYSLDNLKKALEKIKIFLNRL